MLQYLQRCGPEEKAIVSASIDDRVLDFYGELFDRLFSQPFRPRIGDRRRRNEVLRQVEAAADAASASLTRFFLNQQLSEATVEEILAIFEAIADLLKLENISNPNVTTDAIVAKLLESLPYPQNLQGASVSVYRLALYTIVQVLMLVGPVMAEWQKLNFSSTFELPRKVVNRLNETSSQIDAQGRSGQAGADERYELLYRDYLLQRFYQVEAGTVRMTTNLDVDLRELFVMPRVAVRPFSQLGEGEENEIGFSLMGLAAARQRYGELGDRIGQAPKSKAKEEETDSALDRVKKSDRAVIVGLPGAGKSTFFEWLQVQLASVEEKFVLGEQQAIPLLLRVRQLDLTNLPKGAALIAKATASQDRANLMPDGWLDRQMKAGRVLFMLDGLDETEPEDLQEYLLPWLFDLLEKYPNCHYLISSRPVGYPPGLLRRQKFVECDLLDFNESQIGEYACHWCTAVRLAQNEIEEEARREGEKEGEEIVNGFQSHPYIRDLARNPLMLSAICLVNYFEGGRLPEDRALLYRLCVEGLLHNWDKRRGIHSEFQLQEKLRTCREVALSMQSRDLAECEADDVRNIFADVLGDAERAAKLLEHIRYRTGLLLERRPNVFGFAHLTFQEYLAASAVHEGNRLGIEANQLIREHNDGRWKEVIALYCGLTTTPAKRSAIEQLIVQPDTESLGEVLTESYFCSGSELEQDKELRRRVLERLAVSPASPVSKKRLLIRFPEQEVAPIANALVGTIQSKISFSEAFFWLDDCPDFIETASLLERLQTWQNMTPFQVAEIVMILHGFSPDKMLKKMAEMPGLYNSKFPIVKKGKIQLSCQADFVFFALGERVLKSPEVDGFKISLRQVFYTFLNTSSFRRGTLYFLGTLHTRGIVSKSISFLSFIEKQQLCLLLKQLCNHLKGVRIEGEGLGDRQKAIAALNHWADLLEGKEIPEDETETNLD